MEDDKVLHNILLKKAKEAEYSSFEIEQINLQTETLFIRYFLEREASKEFSTILNPPFGNIALFKGASVCSPTIVSKFLSIYPAP